MVDIRCDVQQLDESGYVWAFLDEAHDPGVISPGAIVVAGDDDEPVFAQVIDIVGDGADRRVHLTSHLVPRASTCAPPLVPSSLGVHQLDWSMSPGQPRRLVARSISL